MKCPVCGAAELIHDTRDLPYTYKGDATMIPAVSPSPTCRRLSASCARCRCLTGK
jgi:hypothetical protein